jgi:O-antigen/teichoic acid export membrane protein
VKLYKVINTIFLSYIFSTLSFISGYLIRIIATRTLNPQELGLAYTIIYISLFLAEIFDLGIRKSFNFLYHNIKDKKEKNLSYYFILKISLFFLSLIILTLFKPFFMGLLKLEEDYLYYLLILVFSAFYIYMDLNNLFFIKIKPVYSQFFNFLRYLGIIILFLLFLKIFNEDLMFLFLNSWIYSSLIVSFIILLYITKQHGLIFIKLTKRSWNILKNLVKKGFFLLFLDLSHYFMFYIDTFIIIYFLGYSNYAYYNLAYSVLNFPSFLFSTLAGYLFPLTLKNKELIKKYYPELIKLLIYIIVPFSLLFLLYSKEIILVLFSKNYLETYKILAVFSIFLIFYLIKNYLVPIVSGLEKLKFLLFLNLSVGTLNLVLNLLAVIFLKKLVFIALATGISWLIFYLILEYKIKRELKVKDTLFSFYFLKVFLQSLLLVFFVYLIKTNLNVNIYLEFLIVAVFSAIFYLIISFLFKTTPSSILELMNMVINSLKTIVERKN